MGLLRWGIGSARGHYIRTTNNKKHGVTAVSRTEFELAIPILERFKP